MLKRINALYLSYIQQYWDNSSAHTYVDEVRKLDTSIVDQFGLGYAPESSKNCIDFFMEKGFSIEDLQVAGLVKENERGAYCFFRDRLMFPIWDHMHHVV